MTTIDHLTLAHVTGGIDFASKLSEFSPTGFFSDLGTKLGRYAAPQQVGPTRPAPMPEFDPMPKSNLADTLGRMAPR